MSDRIVTRPDFDGVVCAVLLKEALGKHLPILWAQPNQIQNGTISVKSSDIVANLPVVGDCALWFDHHVSNETKRTYDGLFRIAPSAAGLIFEYFRSKISADFSELVRQTDKIDSAALSHEEILTPEAYPYILVSMTIGIGDGHDLDYCDRLVEWLGRLTIDQLLEQPEVKVRCDQVVAENNAYEHHLKAATSLQGPVSVTDFRNFDPVPNGNRFLVYSLFPQSVVNMKLYLEKGLTVVKLGHSIINRGCNVNVGRLLARYGGGGHRGAGACRLDPRKAESSVAEILEVLVRNKS